LFPFNTEGLPTIQVSPPFQRLKKPATEPTEGQVSFRNGQKSSLQTPNLIKKQQKSLFMISAKPEARPRQLFGSNRQGVSTEISLLDCCDNESQQLSFS
jgi:hypothetical protein